MAKKRKNQKGSALIFALLLMLVISVMGASMMFLSQSETWSSMNYRMMSQSRYGAESGLSLAADYIVNQYTAPTAASGDPLANYDMTSTPVKYGGQPVVLSSIAGKSNYPLGTVVTAFHDAMNNPGNISAGNTTVDYEATAELLSMGTVTSYGNPITVQMWKITADGTINSVRSSTERVTAILERQITPSNVYAAFATSNGCGALIFSGGGTTDSYNSTLLTVNAAGVATAPSSYNTYGGNVGANGNLAENGAKTTIYGTMSTPDTGVGNCSGGNVTAWTDNGKAQVTGGLVKLPQIVVFPLPVIPPPGTTNVNVASGDFDPKTNTLNKCGTTLGPGSDANYPNYGNITLSGQAVLCLTPGTYNINEISQTGANSAIVLLPYQSGPKAGQYDTVTLNVTGNNTTTPIDLGGNGFSNPTLNPSLLQVNYAGTGDINLNGNTQSAAVIYAPVANVTLTGGSDFYGAVLGHTVKDAGATSIHYDLNLMNKSFIVSNYMIDSFNWEKF